MTKPHTTNDQSPRACEWQQTLVRSILEGRQARRRWRRVFFLLLAILLCVLPFTIRAIQAFRDL